MFRYVCTQIVFCFVFSAFAVMQSSAFGINCEEHYRDIGFYVGQANQAKQRSLFREQPRRISTHESTITTDMHSRILPTFRDPNNHGFFIGAEGRKIFYRKFLVKNEKGSVVISHGLAEGSSKWAETVFNLMENGYSVYILDHRGHGKSEKLVDNHKMVHVEKFEHYVEDFERFMNLVVNKDDFEGRKKYLLGYSMGAAVGTLFLKANPEAFDKMTMVAPMYMINIPFTPTYLANAILRIGRWWHGPEKYAFGAADSWATDPPFRINNLTTSSKRYLIKRLRYWHFDEVPQGGPSFHWTIEAMWGARAARRAASKISTPGLVIQAENDNVVSKWAERQFCKHAPNCGRLLIPGAGHDIFQESDPIRDQVIHSILEFWEAP